MPSVSLAETRGEAIGDAAADGHLTKSLRAAPGPCGPPSQAQQNQNPAQQNQSPVQQNPNPSQRDPNRSSFHDLEASQSVSADFGTRWQYDICANGALSSECGPEPPTIRFSEFDHHFASLARKCLISRKQFVRRWDQRPRALPRDQPPDRLAAVHQPARIALARAEGLARLWADKA